MKQGFLSPRWPLLPYQGQCLILSCWSRSPEIQPQAGSCSLQVCAFPLPTPGSLPQRWSMLKQGGMCGLSAHVSHRQMSKLPLIHCLCRHQKLFPLPCSDTALGPSPLCLSQPITPHSLCCPSPIVDLHLKAGRTYMDSWHVLWGELLTVG